MSVAASPVATFPGPRNNQRVQLFSGLGPEEMSRITAHARSLRKARGEFIYMPGDLAGCVYILKQGRLKLSVLSESGKEIAIDIIPKLAFSYIKLAQRNTPSLTGRVRCFPGARQLPLFAADRRLVPLN